MWSPLGLALALAARGEMGMKMPMGERMPVGGLECQEFSSALRASGVAQLTQSSRTRSVHTSYLIAQPGTGRPSQHGRTAGGVSHGHGDMDMVHAHVHVHATWTWVYMHVHACAYHCVRKYLIEKYILDMHGTLSDCLLVVALQIWPTQRCPTTLSSCVWSEQLPLNWRAIAGAREAMIVS